MIVVIGTRALSLRGLDIPFNDIDIIVDVPTWFELSNKDNIHNGVGAFGKVRSKVGNKSLEVGLLGKYDSDAWLFENIDGRWLHTYCDVLKELVYVPPLELLFLMKKSHVHCDSVHFDKTIKHYTKLRDLLRNSTIPVEYDEFFKLRKAEAEHRYKHKTPSLMVTNDEFFNRSKDSVGYVFVHDTIHEAVKHFDVPVYEMIKRDFSKAACEADLFHALPLDKKVKCVQEEAYVIALERYILQDVGVSPYDAYKKALQRICTTLCSGFFREFAIEYYYEVLSAYDAYFLKKFEKAFNDKTIKCMDGVSEHTIDAVMTTYIENVN